jgi:NAD-dependent aldehyde dehydrogenases
MTSDVHAHQSIAGSRSREGDRIFHAWDPTTGTRLEPGYVDATEREIDHAATAAQDAFVTFGRSSGRARADLLDAIAGNVTDAADAIVTRAQAETGLPEARLRGELGRTTGQLRLFADMLREGSWVDARIDTADPSRSPAAKPDIRRMLVPLGPVAVFGASNFPLAFSVAGGDTASALAAGCPVLVKGHPAHPGTSELVATAIERAVRDAGMPAGIFSLLHGAGHDVGGLLARHPGIRAVAFTGSFGGGRALFDAAARRDEPIPVFAEMGSSNPVFVLPRALESRGEHIAEGLYA